MKLIHKIIAFAVISTAVYLTACEDVEISDPNIETTATSSTANFLMVNASSDAPSLDLFVNNEKIGTSVASGQAQSIPYVNVTVPSNGGFSFPLGNLNVRAKATTGVIGGALPSSDLIFRSTNNGTNNFLAADSAFYTFIVMDSISRPKPLRTTNALGIGDTTYFNPLTGQYIAGITRALLPAAQKSKTVAIGTVPLGASDPGGIRFIAITDQLPLPSTTRFPKPAAGKFAVRFIQTAPDITSSVSVTINAIALTSGITTYPLVFPTFSPSVGSRSTTASFANNFADSATPFDIVVKSGATEIARLNAQSFDDKGVYTIVMHGQRNNGTLALTVLKNK